MRIKLSFAPNSEMHTREIAAERRDAAGARYHRRAKMHLRNRNVMQVFFLSLSEWNILLVKQFGCLFADAELLH